MSTCDAHQDGCFPRIFCFPPIKCPRCDRLQCFVFKSIRQGALETSIWKSIWLPWNLACTSAQSVCGWSCKWASLASWTSDTGLPRHGWKRCCFTLLEISSSCIHATKTMFERATCTCKETDADVFIQWAGCARKMRQAGGHGRTGMYIYTYHIYIHTNMYIFLGGANQSGRETPSTGENKQIRESKVHKSIVKLYTSSQLPAEQWRWQVFCTNTLGKCIRSRLSIFEATCWAEVVDFSLALRAIFGRKLRSERTDVACFDVLRV